MISTDDGCGLSEGERWAREALDALRARSFSPPGVVEFLAASLARARRVRTRRPDLVSQSRRFGAVGLGASVALGPRASIRWLAWWAMLDWHLGMAETDGSEPRALGAADALSLARLWMAPLARRAPHPALIAAASATDLLDGLLARRAGPTRLGRELDSAADASFFHAAVSGLVRRRSLDPWVLAAERAHLLVVVGAGAATYLGASARPAAPGPRALRATFGATGLLLAAVGDRGSPGGSRAGSGVIRSTDCGARGGRRAGRRASHALLAGALAARTLRGLRASGLARGGGRRPW